MKLRLPHTLLRALMACFAALVSPSLASASSSPASAATVKWAAPDVEQDSPLLCWAASAADILSLETGQDATAIYRSITEASGNTPGYVETAISWYMEGAQGELESQTYDGSHTVTRHHFESIEALADSLGEALKENRAASIMLYEDGDRQSTGHAVTIYASEYENDRLYLHYVDSADGVQGIRRAEVVEHEAGFALAGTEQVIGSVICLGEDASLAAAEEETAPGAPVAGFMHSSPTLQEYTDIAYGAGVYRFEGSTSLIYYQNGEPTYTLQYTPSFTSSSDGGSFTLISNGAYQLTVAHNGTMSNATFSSRYVGGYSQAYSGVGVRYVNNFITGDSGAADNPYIPMGADFRIERLTRLATDATSSAYVTDTSVYDNMQGTLIYRAGVGHSGIYNSQGELTNEWLYVGYIAGITSASGSSAEDKGAAGTVYSVGFGFSSGDYTQCTTASPLPTASGQGDSGSPVYIYNESTGRFELVAMTQGGTNRDSGSYFNVEAVEQAQAYLSREIETGTSGETIYIEGAMAREDDTTITGTGNNKTYTATLHRGQVTQGDTVLSEYNGVALDVFSQGTWTALDEETYNSNTWYTYLDNSTYDSQGNIVRQGYINAEVDANDVDSFGHKDLYYTSSLHFVAQTSNQSIELKDDVDLGAGHVQFSLGEGMTSATFNIGEASSDLYLSSAGFIVDAGVTLNNYFTYDAGRELRRTGEGVMNMVGEGDNNVLLNIGGGGLTYLDRANGYAAYNVFVGTNATLRLHDIGQVKRNITLGAGGGTLDLNGNDYSWTATEGVQADGTFSLTVYEGINRVETSAIANLQEGTVSTLTIGRTGEFEFAGAFRDGSTYTGGSSIEMDSRYTMMPNDLIGYYTQHDASARQDSNSVLQVIYNGGGTMTMTGVYTILTGSTGGESSGLTVANGRVRLQGTNTIHSVDYWGGRWYDNSNDWHFAMAEMDVQVNSGATFELGHHSLLIGDINVAGGGSYVMKQAVNKANEYVEGWYFTEDMSLLADYYGHKGNVNLESGANMRVEFDAGVSTSLTYAGNITGAGSLSVDVGEGKLTLSGQNSFSGSKTVESGYVYVAEGAEGDTTRNLWKVQQEEGEATGVLALEAAKSAEDIETLVDSSSNGILALTNDINLQVSTELLPNLIIGAAEGKEVHYGQSALTLQAVNGEWKLGGGGGTLVVDFLLTGDNKLVLGTDDATGIVRLTNENNSFTGGIDILGGVTLEYTHVNALGGGVTVGYGATLVALDSNLLSSGKLDTASDGVLALSADAAGDAYNLTNYANLALGAKGDVSLTGTLTLAEGADYRFGGSGTLTLATELSGARDIIIDGQGTSGSSVIMDTVSAASGSVTVQGYATGSASEGDVRLSFASDNTLGAASSVSLLNNGTIDLNGTNQQLNNLTGDASSLIYDNVGGNTLTLNNTAETTFSGSLQLTGTSVLKSGSGTLVLSGTNEWKDLTIAGGTVKATKTASLSSGQKGDISVLDGGTLHISDNFTIDNTINIAGAGAGENSGALILEYWYQNEGQTIKLTGDATLVTRGGFRLGTIDLGGHSLTVTGTSGSHISLAKSFVGGGGSLTVDGMHLRSLEGSNYHLKVTGNGSLNIDGYNGGAFIALELDNGSFNMGNSGVSDGSEAGSSTFQGTLSVGANGATISNSSGYASKQFNLSGKISGDSAAGTLHLRGWQRVINLSGGMELAGSLDMGNGLTANLTKNASVGSLISGEGSSGDASTLRVDGATLELTGSGSDYSRGVIELTNAAHLQLTGLADGASMGSLNSLNMGTDGVLTFASLAGYTGSNAMMDITSIAGTRRLEIDAASLGTLTDGSTYHLLTSANELSGWTLVNNTTDARLSLELVSGGSSGAYTLDLKVTGQAATATWLGTGTLVAGTANSSNISSTANDSTFKTLDALVITSNANASNTLTLGGEILASSVTYTGDGTVRIVPGEGGKFADGVGLTLNGTGRLELDKTTDFSPGDDWGYKTVTGDVLLQKGTLAASTYTLNAMASITVTGEAALELVNPDGAGVTRQILIEEGARLTFTPLSEWGSTMRDNLAGAGAFIKTGEYQLNLFGNHSAFTGTLVVQQGELRMGEGWQNNTLSGFSLNASSISVGSGATLSLNSGAVNFGAEFAWADGAKLNIVDGTTDKGDHDIIAYTFSGTQTLAGELLIQNNWGKVVHISGDIVDAEGASGSLNFTSEAKEAPAFILSGDNSYSGGTIINDANFTLIATNRNALGTGALTLTSGTFAWRDVGVDDWNGDLAVSSIVLGSGALDTKAQNVYLSTEISGTGDLIKMGDGTLTLDGTLSYTGETKLESGSLVLNSELASSADITVNKATILRVNGDYLNGNTVNLNSALSGKVAQVIGSAQALGGASDYVIKTDGLAKAVGYIGITGAEGGTFGSNVSSTNGTLLLEAAGHVIVSGTLSGEMNVSALGNFTFSGANTYTGGTELAGGSLQLASATALGTGALVAHEGTSVSIANGVAATISGESSVDALVFGEGASVTVGAAGEVGQLSFGSVSGNATFTLDIFGENSYDTLVGDLTGGTLNVNIVGTELPIGRYTIITGDVADASSFTLNVSGALDTTTYSYGLRNLEDGSGLFFYIDRATGTINTWTGGESGVWDSTSANWINTNEGTASAFNTALAETAVRVLPNGSTAIRVTENVSTTTLYAETGKGAVLSFSSDGGSITADKLVQDGLGKVTFSGSHSFGAVEVTDGTVSVAVENGVNPLGTTNISGEGTFELTGGSLSANAGTLTVKNIALSTSRLSVDGTFSGQNFAIGSGGELVMGHWAGINSSTILLTEGGKLVMDSSGFSGNVVNVEGNGIFAIGQTSGTVDDDHRLDVNSSFTGNGVLKITNFTEYSSEGYTGKMASSYTISDAAGGSLAVVTDIHGLELAGTNTYSGGTTILGGSVTTSNASALGTGALHMASGSLTMQSALSIGSLSGESSASIDRGTSTLIIKQGADGTYAGTLSGTGSLIKQGAGTLSLTNTAAIIATDLAVEQGALNIAGAVTVTGEFTHAVGTSVSFGALTLSQPKDFHMTHTEGTSLTITGALTLASGSSLNYSVLGDHRTQVGSLAVSDGNALTINLSEALIGYLTDRDADGKLNSYDLGVNLTGLTLTVTGHEEHDNCYTITEKDGHSYFQLTETSEWVQNFKEIAWDANWGEAGLAGAPEKAWQATLSETSGLYNAASATPYDNGTRIVAKVAGAAGEVINLYALVDAETTTEAGGTLTRDAWVEVTGGTFGVISGANLNNWQGETAWNLEGDIHLMLNGGTADDVVGFSHKDALTPHLEGDTYISIGQDAQVLDSVIGGGVVRHSAGLTMTGNTNVVVNALLSDDSTALNGEGIGNRHNSVIGGHAWGSGAADENVELTLTGSTNVLVNLVDGQSGTFAKTIAGGNRSNSTLSTITGNTAVTINASNSVTFDDDIVAGSVSSGVSETIGGGSTLTINGGTYSGGIDKFLIGGSWVTGGESVIEGTAAIILNGGVINRHVFVAGYSGGGESTVGSTRLEIGSGVTIGDGIKLSGGFTSSARGTVEGDRTLALHDGVDLSTTTSTLENFDHIEVKTDAATRASKGAGSAVATLDAAKFVNLTEYTKTGDGTLVLTGTVREASNTNRLTINDGTVRLDSTTALRHDGTGNTAVVISNGSLILGAETVSDYAIGSLSGGIHSTLDIGSHNLTINQTAAGTFAGNILTSGSSSLTKTGAGNLQMTQHEALSLANLSVQGGILHLASDLTLSGAFNQSAGTSVELHTLTLTAVSTLAMNQAADTSLIIDSLTLAEGSTLTYSGLENRTTIGSLAVAGSGALTLNLESSMLTALDQGYGVYDVLDLGVTLTNTDSVTVTGLEGQTNLQTSFGVDATTGHTTLLITDTNYSDLVPWDTNWGEKEIAGAPARARLTTISGNTSFYGKDMFDDGTEHIVAVVTGTEGVANLFATTLDGTAVARDIWLDIEGGEFGVIAGSQASGNITGDVHIQMRGGEVDRIIGFNNGGGAASTHEGSSYISVSGDALINDSIAGAGSTDSAKDVTLTGNTHVYVYNVQSSNGDYNGTYTGDNLARNNAIVGGFIRTNGWGMTWKIDGSTNVTIDIADSTAVGADFVKHIYGGQVSETFSHISTITGDTHVSIGAPDELVFTGNIVAGSMKSGAEPGRTDVIQGSTTLTINGGTFAEGAYLTGGSLVSGGTSAIGGNLSSVGDWGTPVFSATGGKASVILNGGVINRDVYAAGIMTGGTSYVANTMVEIASGASLGAVVVSGGFGGSGGTGTVTGERTLHLLDGVNLAATGGSFKDFDKVEVDAGNRAALKADSLSSITSLKKAGSGTLALSGSTGTALNLAAGKLEVAAGNSLTLGGLSGSTSSAEVLLNGALTLNQAEASSYAGHITGAGTLTQAGAGSLTVSSSNNSAGSLVVTGEGSLSVETITLSGTQNMNQVGLSIGALTMADGATLAYTAAALKGTLLEVGSFTAQGSLTLNISADLLAGLNLANGASEELGLGVKLTSTDGVSVTGLEEGMTYAFGEVSGLTTLVITGANTDTLESVVWDANWGVSGAPTEAWNTALNETTGFYGLEKFDDGTNIVASVKGTTETINVFASLNLQDASTAGVTMERDAWLEVTDGTFGVIGGANINNWSNWGKSTITGDIHLLVKGGNADYVVGFTHKDAANPLLKGDTYVSVYEGATINDSVIGGGVSQHGHSFTIEGNTNVFVYGLLKNATRNHGTNDNKDILWSSEESANAVIGANVWGHNSGATMSLTGNSSVTVDVSASEGGSFEKHIYGGNASYALTANIGGNTAVSITANENVSFTGNVVAGSYTTGNADTIEGDSTLTINSGVYTSGAYLTGGSVVAGGTSTIDGTASVILNGGSIERDVYAAGISNGGTSTVGNSLVEVGNAVSFGAVTVSGGFGGTAADSGSVTGTRTLALADGVNLADSSVSFTDFDAISVSSGTATLSGAGISLAELTKQGSGTLSVAGSGLSTSTLVVEQGQLNVAGATLSGALAMNQSGLTIDALTMADGASLSYTENGNLASVGSFTAAGSLTLNVTESLISGLVQANGFYTDLSLGVALGSSTEHVSVTGLASNLTYSFGTDSEGKSTLQITDKAYSFVSWDTAWGKESAPSNAWHTTLTETTAFSGSAKYDDGTNIVVSASGTTGVVDLFATVNLAGEWDSSVSLNRNAWVEVTGGTYGIIAGARLNNWNAAASSFEGDFHYAIKGGSVNDVIGLSYQDALKPTFESSTYISVYEGSTINDSIIGGAELQHYAGVEMTGNTNIFIYDVLDTNAETLEGSHSLKRYNAVIGGHAYGTNQKGHPMSITGSTNVLVDVSDYEGAATNFVKGVFGGHMMGTEGDGWGGMYYNIGTITEGSHVSLSANELVSFTADIVAGSKVAANNTDTISGGTSLTLDGGIYAAGALLTGGSWNAGGTSTINGTASVTLTSGTMNRDVYAAGIVSDGGTSTVENSLVEIGSDMSFGDVTVSGGFGGTGGTGTVTGTRTLSLVDGVNLADSAVSFTDFDDLQVTSGNASLNAAALGMASVDKTGEGSLTLSGVGTAALNMEAGSLVLAADLTLGGLSGSEGVAVNVGSHTLTLNQSADSSYSGTLSGSGTLAMSGTGTLTLGSDFAGTLSVNAGKVQLSGDRSIGGLSGTGGSVEMGGDLIISQSGESSYAGALTGSGTLTKEGEGTQNLTGSGLTAGSLVVSGGALAIENDITLSGDLAMNQSGLSIGSLTMGAGTSLLYTEVGNLASIGSFTAAGALTLNLSEGLVTELLQDNGLYYDDLNLGVTLGSDTSQVSVSGLGSSLRYEFTTGEDGKTLLQITHVDYSSVAWDSAWKKTDAPTMAWHTTLSENTAFYGNSKYDDGSSIVVSVTGTTGENAVNLYATTADGSSPTRSAWVEVSGGSFGTIAGSSGGSITGDMHFMLTGGTVDNIIAFNATTANGAPTHTGSSWISVSEDAVVNDSIIGAGMSTNGNGGTLNGSTNIFVYNVLSAGEASTGTAEPGDTWNYNAIIGGFARTTGYGVTWVIDGSTNVTVDVSEGSGNFVKSIYGGNVSERFSHIGTITGDTNVSISAADAVSFSGNVVAGSYKGGDEAHRTDVIEGNTTLTINGGTFASGGYLTGGSLVSGGTSAIGGTLDDSQNFTSTGGTASVILNGGIINRDVYAAGISNGGKSYVANSLVYVGSDVELGDAITVSGGFGGTATSNGSVTGNRTLSLADGVDLSASSATIKDFTHLVVEAGSASLNASTLSNMNSFTKSGDGALVLGGSGNMAYTGNRLDITVEASPTRAAGEGELEISAAIAGNVHLYKEGAGTLKLSGANTFGWGFNVNAGTLIAAGNRSLGVGSVDVANGATLEIASGIYVDLDHYLKMAAGSELVVHSLQTDVAAVAANYNGSEAKNFTLTLAEDIELDSGSKYLVFSGMATSNISGVTVNHEGVGRYSFETSAESDALYLTAEQDVNRSLVWDGAETSGNWNQLAPNKNWNEAENGNDISFMNKDSVSFTEAAANKQVAVAEGGVQVESMTVSGADYRFSGGAIHANSVTAGSAMTLETGASLSVGEAFSLKHAEGESAKLSNVKMTQEQDSGLIVRAGNDGLCALDNAVIEIAKGKNLTVKDVVLRGGSRISGAADASEVANLVLDNVKVELSKLNTSTLENPSSLLSAGTTLAYVGGGGSSVTLDTDANVYNIFSSAFDNVHVTGTTLTIDLSSYADALVEGRAFADYVALSFGSSSDKLASFDATSLSIRATYDGGLSFANVYVVKNDSAAAAAMSAGAGASSGTGSAGSVSVKLYIATTSNIPEPTTSTLGLLALSLLLGHRRRRD